MKTRNSIILSQTDKFFVRVYIISKVHTNVQW